MDDKACCELFDDLWKENNPDSDKKMIEILQESVNALSGPAIGRLAKAYRDGRGVEKDPEKAKKLFSIAANSGDSTSAYELFEILWKENTPESDSEMIRVIQKYVDSESGPAIGRLARAYRDGRGVEKDPEKAQNLMKKAAKKGVAWAANELFDMYWTIKTNESDKEMVEIIKPYLNTNGHSMSRMARSYRDGRGVKQDLFAAYTWMKKSIDTGKLNNRLGLAKIILKCDAFQDKSEAIDILEQMVSEKNESAIYLLSKLLFWGEYVSKNVDRSIQLLESLNTDQSKLYLSDIFASFNDRDSKDRALQILESVDKEYMPSVKFRKSKWEIEKQLEIKNYIEESEYNIVIISSDEYARYSAVLIKSIVENNPIKINFYIITTNMRECNKSLLTEEVMSNNIQFITINNAIFEKVKFPDIGVKATRWSRTILSKLIPNQLLPESVDKALFLGVDTLVVGNLAELYNIDLSGYYFASAATIKRIKNDMIQDINAPNGCVLLFNVKQFRESNITLDSYEGLFEKCDIDEQLLSHRFKDKILYLDTYKFNYRHDFIRSYVTKYHLMESKPLIYHYVGYMKPWAFCMESDEEYYEYQQELKTQYSHNSMMKKWWHYANQCSNALELQGVHKILKSTIVGHGKSFIDHP